MCNHLEIQNTLSQKVLEYEGILEKTPEFCRKLFLMSSRFKEIQVGIGRFKMVLEKNIQFWIWT